MVHRIVDTAVGLSIIGRISLDCHFERSEKSKVLRQRNGVNGEDFPVCRQAGDPSLRSG